MKPGRKPLLLLAVCLGILLSGGLLRAFGMPAAHSPLDWPVEGEKPGQATLVGRDPTSYFGSSLATGDVNGDGFEDLIAAARYEAGTGLANGAVYVIPGPIADQSTYTMPHRAAVAIEGITDSQLGAIVDAGDMNGDGFDDIAMASLSQMYVYLGSTDIQVSNPITVPIISAPLALTVSPARAGTVFCDLNGDLLQDLFIEDFSSYETGVQFFGTLGSTSLTNTLPLNIQLPGEADITIEGITNLTSWGTSRQKKMACGDFNGDGTPDLALGVPTENPHTQFQAGSVYIIPGDPGITAGKPLTLTMPAQAGAILDGLDGYEGGEGGDQFGTSLAAADINQDGKDDLIISAPGGWGVNNWYGFAGEIYLWLGRAFTGQRSPISAQASWVVYGEDIYNYLGFSLATGDFDGDGAPEILAGCPVCDVRNEPYAISGKGYAFEPLDFSGVVRVDQVAQVRILPYTYSPELGSAVISLDLSHDGYSDLLISAPSMYDPEHDFPGAIYAISYPIRTRIFLPFIILGGGNHSALAGRGSRHPLLKWVYTKRSPPQPTQRVNNQLSPGLDTGLSKKGFGWTCRGKVERTVGGNRHPIRF